jgi:HEPN domain-containing protein
MASDDLRVRATRDWLAYASDDLTVAASGLEEGSPAFLRDAAFHCQQSAEKALKAFLVWNDIPFPRVHDLEDIGARCVELDASLRSIAEQAAELSQYAWRFRYPGEPYEPTPEEVQQALRFAQATYRSILDRLPTEVRP